MAKLIRTSALLLYLARLWFSRSIITNPSLWRMGAGWRLWRMSWFIACQFVDSMAWVLLTRILTVLSVCSISFVELLKFLFGVFGGCAARVHATSFLCSLRYFGFLSPRRFARRQCSCCGMPSCFSGLGFFLFISSFCLVAHAAFSCRKIINL
jgi:hypothetical protein